MRVDEKLTRGGVLQRHALGERKPNNPVRTSRGTSNSRSYPGIFYLLFEKGGRKIDIRQLRLENNPRGFHYVDLADFHLFKNGWKRASWAGEARGAVRENS